MKPLRSNAFLSARGDRIARAWALPSCPPSPPGGQVRTAPVVPSPATGAGFSLDSCAETVGRTAQETAPAFNPKPPAQTGAVILSEHALILLRAVAAYEQIDSAAAVTLALATHCHRIGAGPLARAALDEIERAGAQSHNRESETDGGEGDPACRPSATAPGVRLAESPFRGFPDASLTPAGLIDGEDLHAVPNFRRIGENLFRGGGP